MINSATLLVCDLVLQRYIEVMTEHPERVEPSFRAMIVDAASDVHRARTDEFMAIQRALKAVPTFEAASDLFSQPGSRGYRPEDQAPAVPASPE